MLLATVNLARREGIPFSIVNLKYCRLNWLSFVVLAHNLNAIMKRQVLGKSWSSKRMKAMRFSFIKLPGRVVERSRSLIIRLTKNHPSLGMLIEARKRIAMMVPVPSG